MPCPPVPYALRATILGVPWEELSRAAAVDELDRRDRVELGEVRRVRVLCVRLVPEADAADRRDGAELLPGVGCFPTGGLELLARVDDRLAGAGFLRHTGRRRHF